VPSLSPGCTIVGRLPPPLVHHEEMDDIAGTVRAELSAKRTELLEQMGLLEQKPTDHGSISFGKRVGEGTSMAVDRLSQVGVHDRLQTTLADVDRALAKLDEGTYGRCDVCGGPIGEERLEALPWAVRCVQDAGRP
jgi:DnaK suppressor protein